MSLERIKELIPHRDSMLLVDEIVNIEGNSIVCKKTFRPDEHFYKGHYPGNPITPGVILCESAVQAGAVLAASINEGKESKVTPVLARISDCRFKLPVFPGDTVELHATLDEVSSGFHFYTGKVLVGGKLAVRLKYVAAGQPISEEG